MRVALEKGVEVVSVNDPFIDLEYMVGNIYCLCDFTLLVSWQDVFLACSRVSVSQSIIIKTAFMDSGVTA